MTSAAPDEQPVREQAAREQAAREQGGRERLAALGCEVVDMAQGAYVVGTLGPVVIVCIGRDAGAAGHDAFSVANAQVARKHAKLAHLVLFGEGCTLPGVDERQAVVEVLRSFQDQIVGASMVLEGRGLMTVLLRSIVNVVDRINRSPHPTRMFPAAPEAASWLVQTLDSGDAPSGAQLADAVVALRRLL